MIRRWLVVRGAVVLAVLALHTVLAELAGRADPFAAAMVGHAGPLALGALLLVVRLGLFFVVPAWLAVGAVKLGLRLRALPATADAAREGDGSRLQERDQS